MPTQACPACQAAEPHLLSVLSELSWAVNYFRCATCGHIWTVTKDGKQIVAHVTMHHEPADPSDPQEQ